MKKTHSANIITAAKILIIALTIAGAMRDAAYCANPSPAFQPGETLSFSIRWGVIPAGSAEMRVMPIQTVNGVDSYHFVLTASSNSVIDVFYKVRDRIDAFVDTALSHSTLYRKKQREGGSKRDIEVSFDWNKQTTTYSNFGKSKKAIPIEPGTFDPLGIFYYIRSVDMKENDVIVRPATDGKKIVSATARVASKETVSVPAGSFEAFLLESELKHVGGEFKKAKDTELKVWLTADHRKIPVKVQIGNFVGELVSAEHAGDFNDNP